MPKSGPVHLTTIRRSYKGKQYVSHLLRRSFRDGGKVKSQTVGNLSALPPEAIEAVRAILRGEAVGQLDTRIEIERSLPHGNVLAVLGALRSLGLEKMLGPACRERDLAVGMIAARVLTPASKLATTRLWNTSTLASVLGIADASEDDLYGAMDWLGERQATVEDRLAAKHLADGGMVFYDLSSTYFEGRECPLARLGYSRDGLRGTLQIEFGIITDPSGRPVAIEVFNGNTADPSTVASQVDKLKHRFKLDDVVLVGDRGMLTSARITALKEVGGIQWISSLRSPQIRALVDSGTLQLGIFDQTDLAEIVSEAFPGERLVVCKNPLLAAERARKREDLLQATEVELDKIVARVERGNLVDAGAIGIAVGRVVQRYKMSKHFVKAISHGSFSYHRDHGAIREEAALDGIYIVRTSLSQSRLGAADVVRAYKRLSLAERAFRGMKSSDLAVRPVHHRLEQRVRSHMFICMLAYYVQWHLQQAWAPLLFKDEDRPFQDDPVAPARRSHAALQKASSGRTTAGTRAHSLRTLLKEMETLTRNRVVPQGADTSAGFDMLATPTQLQARALALLNLSTSSL